MDMRNVTWRRSVRSGMNGENCVEVARLDGVIGIRDSKCVDAGHLVMNSVAFAKMIRALKD